MCSCASAFSGSAVGGHLFLLVLRRSSERAGRLVERLETMEKVNDVQPGCWMPRLAVLAIATSLLTACATVASDPRTATVCPPVVKYNREFQARAAEELARLSDGSAIANMLADYSVMREQVRVCGWT